MMTPYRPEQGAESLLEAVIKQSAKDIYTAKRNGLLHAKNWLGRRVDYMTKKDLDGAKNFFENGDCDFVVEALGYDLDSEVLYERIMK